MRPMLVALTATASFLLPAGIRHVAAAEPATLRLTPVEIEKPLFAHRLLPDAGEVREGNAAPILLRLAWEQPEFMRTAGDRFARQLEVPLSQTAEILALGTGLDDHVVAEMRRAAYRKTASWEYPLDDRPRSTLILLPDIQGSRLFVQQGLSVWIRYQIAAAELEQAREGILTGLAVARHYARTPLAINNRVAISHADAMLTRLEELIQHPAAPNFYWPLSILPAPFVDLQPVWEMERELLVAEVTHPSDVEKDQWFGDLDQPHTEDEWERFARRLVTATPELIEKALNELNELQPELSGGVANMSDAECLVRWCVAVHRDFADRVIAAAALEPRDAIPQLDRLEQEAQRGLAEGRIRTSDAMIAKPLGTYFAALHLQRRIALLRGVEAVRHHTAVHGAPPESLAELKDPPFPRDPLTNAPFEYARVDGGVRIFGLETSQGKSMDVQVLLTSDNRR